MIDTNKLTDAIDIMHCIEYYTGARFRNYRTKCPFPDHSDRTASFTVQSRKGVWHCWGCGRGGNVVNFTREFFGLDFVDACRKLSQDFGVDDIGLPEERNKTPSPWDEIEREIQRDRREELRQLREENRLAIIDLLAQHREAFRADDAERCEVINEKIADLQFIKDTFF